MTPFCGQDSAGFLSGISQSAWGNQTHIHNNTSFWKRNKTRCAFTQPQSMSTTIMKKWNTHSYIHTTHAYTYFMLQPSPVYLYSSHHCFWYPNQNGIAYSPPQLSASVMRCKHVLLIKKCKTTAWCKSRHWNWHPPLHKDRYRYAAISICDQLWQSVDLGIVNYWQWHQLNVKSISFNLM